MNENPLGSKDNSDSADSLPGWNPAEPTLTRRSFLGKIIALGALAHFSLLQQSMGADDGCRDVSPNNDNCDPDNQDPDACPTGAAVQDVCSNNDPDVCYSGLAPEDACPPNGGIAQGDVCRGGGSSIGGAEMDTCENNEGDQCTPGKTGLGGEVCDETNPDICKRWNDDTCYLGVPSPTTGGGEGGYDACNKWSSDACPDGSDAQDRCEPSDNWWGTSGQEDNCCGNGTDQCKISIGDEDECSKFSVEDICEKTGKETSDLCLLDAGKDTCDLYARDPE